MSYIIRLQNLSRTARASDIREFFSGLSIPSGSVCIVGGDSGDAFIGFETDEDARLAMFRTGKILGQSQVELSLSSKKEMNQAMERAQQLSRLLHNFDKKEESSSSHQDVYSQNTLSYSTSGMLGAFALIIIHYSALIFFKVFQNYDYKKNYCSFSKIYKPSFLNSKEKITLVQNISLSDI